MKPTFAIAEVKSAASDSPNGEFEIVMSTDSVDRDGEVIVKGAFDPLPASIPVHVFHDFSRPVGRAVPSYDTEGRLVGRGFFGSDPESQKTRQQVVDGVIAHTSVGFMAADRDVKDGVPHITKAELLEVSFVSVPSNRDAAVYMAKEYAAERAAETDIQARVTQLEEQVKSLLADSIKGKLGPDGEQSGFLAAVSEVIEKRARKDSEIGRSSSGLFTARAHTAMVNGGALGVPTKSVGSIEQMAETLLGEEDTLPVKSAALRAEIAAAQAATVL